MTNNKLSRYLVSQIAKKIPKAVFLKETNRKIISLTIDDIPAQNEDDKQSARKILEAIEAHNESFSTTVSATFFITTDHVKYESDKSKLDLDILKEISDKGHEIGNHGKIDRRHASLSKIEFETEFLEAHQFLSQHISQPVCWFRPGQGFFNKSMFDTLITVGQSLGYQEKFALASMIPFDTLKFLDDPDFTLKNIGRFTFPGSILLLHGGFSHQAINTVDVLNKLLPRLHEHNYQVVSLSKLMLS
ncbi:chitin deacetylase family protein [Acaryochloris marina]|uniref:Polysaccharide deacetylase n=1 Tax=Acaryochloris marina (strain MBIC 11017) TaxID=329726 RepID=A8ZP56_ACAM1|nr:chitin deacetylase family protein [Acaryochloris marina]ABW32792.1 polysaccharide deacetylase [Acaryochloris marina MBIC11017]